MRNTIKRILVTGGTGFIGRHLIDRLVKNYEVVAIVRDPSYNRADIKVIHGDITDPDCINNAIHNIDAVVHLAAILDPFDKDIVKINVNSTKNIVDAANMFYVKKIILISSENVLYNFDDMYSGTKRIAEKLVKTFDDYLIIRPTLVYGRYDERYVKKLLDIIKKYNVVPIPGNGKKLFQPVFVEDVVKSIENGLKYDIQGEYVIAGPSKISYDEFAEGVLKELNINKLLVHIPTILLKLVNSFNKRMKKPKFGFFQVKSLEIDKIYDISKTVQIFRYKPTSFKIGIKKTIRPFKTQFGKMI